MKKIIKYILFLGITLLLITYPKSSLENARKGLDMCYQIIIPSLFPFFVCSGLLIYSGFCDALAKCFGPVMKPLFNINPTGAAAFVLGIISGYPLGAVTACQLYEGLYLSKSETERLLAFCNNSGPLFILSAVGISLYKSVKIGVLLYIAHVLGCISVGIIFRFYKKDGFSAPQAKVETEEKGVGEIFSSAVSNSVKNILNVCAVVVFCSVVSNVLLNILSLNENFDAIIAGIFEFASGLTKISALDIGMLMKLVLSAWVCAFAGISVHLQVLGVVQNSGLSLKPYIIGKILHGFFAALYTFVLLNIFPAKESVFLNLSQEKNICGGFYISSLFASISVIAVSVIVIAYMIIDMKKLTAKRYKRTE